MTGLEYATDTQATVVGKPEKTFFLEALRDLGCQPEEAIMIGDVREHRWPLMVELSIVREGGSVARSLIKSVAKCEVRLQSSTWSIDVSQIVVFFTSIHKYRYSWT